MMLCYVRCFSRPPAPNLTSSKWLGCNLQIEPHTGDCSNILGESTTIHASLKEERLLLLLLLLCCCCCWPLTSLYMVVVQNFVLLETAILSQKKFTLAKLSPYSQKTFAGPYVGLYLGIFVRKQKLDKGHLRVWATIKTHSVAAAHSRVAFCF